MGCDIHAAIEYKNSDGAWHCATARPNKYYQPDDKSGDSFSCSPLRYDLELGRDYDMFAILGNVRNGKGFAGCVTGSGYVPISDCRGVPEDSAEETKSALSNEHSATWVTLPEILAYDWTQGAIHEGWVDQGTFEKWDRMKEWNPQPDSWCGGGNFKKISQEEMRQSIKNGVKLGHVMTKLQWETSCAEDGRQIWEKILPLMLKLGHEHGFENVRLVMDFDS